MAATSEDTQPSGTTRETIDDATLDKWHREARKHPSGMRCNGIHDATPDRRVVVLIDMLRAERAAGRTETTTATVEQVAEVIEDAIDDVVDLRDPTRAEMQAAAARAAQALADAGLLWQP